MESGDDYYRSRSKKWMNSNRGFKLFVAAALLVTVGLLAAVVHKTVTNPPAPASSAPSTAVPPTTTASTDPCDGTWSLNEITVDYLVAGGGAGGLQTADDLAQALQTLGGADALKTIAVIEKRTVLGGNLRKTLVASPTGYSPSAGYGTLQADLGMSGVNALTFTNLRRLFTEHNITAYCSPFRNIVQMRGRRSVCEDPWTLGNDNGFNDAYAYGDYCNYHENFTAPDTGAYQLYGDNYTQILSNPSLDAYLWLLQGNTAPDADKIISGDVDGNNDWGDGYIHPLDTDRQCTLGVDCPIDRCHQYVDWRSFVAAELAVDTSRYNHEYANFLRADNLGNHNEYDQPTGACSYLNFYAREFNLVPHYCYPKGGMTSLTDAMHARGAANGVNYYVNEGAQCIRRSNRSGIDYEVRTRTKTFLVRESGFLFMAMPNPAIDDPTVVGGDIMSELREERPFNRSRGSRVISVVMQWPPGEAAWFWSYFDQATGNWSVRNYGDGACYTRIELIDTPERRCTNAISVIYTDSECQSMWDDIMEPAVRTGNWTVVEGRVLPELRAAFPDVEIGAPMSTTGEMLDPASYFARPAYDDISNGEHSEWATQPLGATENLCLIGEAYHLYYRGSAEGALRSSRQCLTARFPANTTLGAALNGVYAARDQSVPGDGSWGSPNFQDTPAGTGTRHFANEQWWPWDYSATTDFCNASQVGITDYPVQVLES